jgi:putative ubiquitin-RnfH superfamily antitoxin RatB of RatAB toxin-antitoxin module
MLRTCPTSQVAEDTNVFDALLPCRELLEPRIAAERRKVGIYPKPTPRKDVWHPEERLEVVERLLGLADEDVDPDQLVLNVGAEVGILTDGPELHRALAISDGLRLPAPEGLRQAVEDRSRAASRISRWKRSGPSVAASSGRRTLRATGRSCLRSRAR